MKYEFDISNIPGEVLMVQAWQNANQPVGLEMYNKISAIIDKYPAYFPWEHAYKKIPKEVHEAYNKEKNPGLFEGLPETKQGGGIMEEVAKYSYKVPETKADLLTIFNEIQAYDQKMREERAADLKANEALWDKHYKKYKLPYRK